MEGIPVICIKGKNVRSGITTQLCRGKFDHNLTRFQEDYTE